MTAEETIQAMYDQYPFLYQDRYDVLNHLFNTLENGFHWENGELVDPELKLPINDLVNGYAKQRIVLADHLMIWRSITKGLKGIPEYITLKRADYWDTIIPGYSYLTSYPDDIKPDWFNILMECATMMIDDGIITKEGDMFIPLKEGILIETEKASTRVKS